MAIFGNIKPPQGVSQFIAKTDNKGGALFLFISNILKLAGVLAGIFAVVQFILAGYTYITAGNDPKMTEKAWATIWQSMVGLLIVGASFTLAAIIGKLTGLDPLNPIIYGP